MRAIPKCVRIVHEEFLGLRDKVTDAELTQGKWLSLREKHCREAYNMVPTWIKEKIVHVFHRDFQLFGYHMPAFK